MRRAAASVLDGAQYVDWSAGSAWTPGLSLQVVVQCLPTQPAGCIDELQP